MAKKTSWERRKVSCPEEKRMARLFLEWHEDEGKVVLNSIVCDNPKLRDLDNSECQWSCWEKISGE